MGTHGTNGFVGNLIGSNTYGVASITRIPLIGVHKGMSRRGYRHIIYPVRDESKAIAKFHHALTFARIFRSRVEVLGLLRPEHRKHEKGIRTQCAAVQKRFRQNGIPTRVNFTYSDFFPEAIIRHAHAFPGSLVATLQDADFHLVEMFQGTFTKKVLHAILSPVLVIPSSRS